LQSITLPARGIPQKTQVSVIGTGKGGIVIYVMRVWAGLIAFVFVLVASAMTLIVAFVSTAVLFVCALVATPFLFFTRNAGTALELITHIVVSPLRFGGETLNDLWSQFWSIVTGRSASREPNNATSLTARLALLLAFSASCLTGIALSPLHGRWEALAFTLTGFVLVTICSAAAMVGWDNDYIARLGTIVILIAFSAAGIVTTILVRLSPNVSKYTFLGEVFGLILIWIVVIASVWDAT
jgi:hypothetical protein